MTSRQQRFYNGFVDILASEVGLETLKLLLEKAALSPDLAQPGPASRFDGETAARDYAAIQRALRAYYGRGIRGILLRVGRLLFVHMLQTAGLPGKVRASLVKALPLVLRRRQALELAASFLGARPGDVTVHTLDLDLLVVDYASPGAKGQTEQYAMCFITLGFLQEALFWAIGREQDVDEIHCCATGHETCEFKIMVS